MFTNDEANLAVMLFPCARHERSGGVIQNSAYVDFYVLKVKIDMHHASSNI